MTEIVDLALHELTFCLDGRGAARGRTERAGLVLEVRTADGRIGRGEASPLPGMSVETLGEARTALAAFVARGRFALANEQTVFALAETVASPSARFAVETALLDVLAQASRTSISGLFDAEAPVTALDEAVARIREIVEGDPAVTLAIERGPQAAPWRARRANPARATATVVDDAGDAATAVRTGARCLKIKIGDQAIDDDVARVRAIAAVSPGATLRLDANQRWPRAAAIANLARFAGLPIEFVEEPCPGAHEIGRAHV